MALQVLSNDRGTSAISHGMVLLDGTPRRGGTSSLFRYMVKVKVFYMMDKSLDFKWFPLHMTMVWYLARGARIPALNNAITQTSVSIVRRRWGFSAPLQSRRLEDIGHRADDRKPSFLAQARKKTSSER